MPLCAAALGLAVLLAVPAGAGIELVPTQTEEPAAEPAPPEPLPKVDDPAPKRETGDPATTVCGRAKAPTAGESVKIQACLAAVEYGSLPTARGADGQERACDFQAACRKGTAAARARMALELKYRDMSSRLDQMPRFPHEQDLAELNLLLATPGLSAARKASLTRRLTELKEDEEVRIRLRREQAAKDREEKPPEVLGSVGAAAKDLPGGGAGLVFDGARPGAGEPAAGPGTAGPPGNSAAEKPAVTPGGGGRLPSTLPAAEPPAPGALARARAGLVSDTRTPVQEVLLQYDEGISDEMLKSFLAKREAGLNVTIMTDGSYIPLANRMRDEWGVKFDGSVAFLPCMDGKDGKCKDRVSAWSRDHFLLKKDGEDYTLLQPAKLQGYYKGPGEHHGGFESGYFQKLRGRSVATSQLNFEGGHVVTGPNGVMVSEDVLYRNPQHTREEIEEIFSRETGKPTKLIPNIPNWPHLDLYVTPTGDKTVTVGDSRAGAAMFRRFAADPKNAGSRVLTELRTGMAGADMGDSVVKDVRTGGLLAFSESDARKLDIIAAKLEKEGYTVKRMPMLTGRLGQNPIFTYNNAFQSGDNIYVPQYGIPDMDAAALETYRRQGLNPIGIPAYDLAKYAGALHCSITALKLRSPTNVPAVAQR